MPTRISDQAILEYQYGLQSDCASSNLASATLQGPLSLTTALLDTSYRADDELIYILRIANAGVYPLEKIVIADDLGTFMLPGPVAVTPLTYRGPARLYINGMFKSVLVPIVTPSNASFRIPALPKSSNALLIYKVTVNDCAPLSIGSVITNEIVVTAPELADSVADSFTVTVEDYADIRITKTMSPNPVTDGNVLTYTFAIYNFGNMDATDVILRDTFLLAPPAITVTVDDAEIDPAFVDYTGGSLRLPKAGSGLSLRVPAAVYTQNPLNGFLIVNPGMMTVTVSGIV